MPLERQTIAIPFRGGIDSKSDPRQTPVAKLQLLENAVFTRPGALQKVNGFDALSREIANPSDASVTAIASGQALATLQNELVLADGARLYSYEAATEKWIDKGPFVSGVLEQTPIVRNSYEQTAQDGATHSSGLQAYAWEDSSGGVRYAVVDTTTAQTVVASRLISTTASRPKVLAFGNFLLIWYVESEDPSAPLLKVLPVPVVNPTQTVAPVQVTAGAGGDFRQISPTAPYYDATVIDGTASNNDTQMYVVFGNNSGYGFTTYSFTESNPTSPSGADHQSTFQDGRAFTIFGDLANAGPVICRWTGTRLDVYAYAEFQPGDAQTLMLDTYIGSVSDLVSVTGVCVDSSAPGYWRIAWSALAAGASSMNACTQICIVEDYTLWPATTLLRSVALAAKAFAYNGLAYFPLVYSAPLGSTYFLADEDGSIVMRCLSGLAGGTSIPGAAMPATFTSTITYSGPGSTYVELGIGASGLVHADGSSAVDMAAALVSAWNADPTASAIATLTRDGATITATAVTPGVGGNNLFLVTINTSGSGWSPTAADYGFYMTGGTGSPYGSVLPEVTAVGGTVFRWSALVRDFLTTLPGTTTTGTSTTATYTQTGVTALTWDFNDAARSYSRALAGGSLVWGGGFAALYDGAQVTELGFHVYPELADADIVTANTGGHLGSATQGTSYWWVVTYEWTDNQGVIYRSAPSVPIEKTFASGTDTGKATLTIPTLRLTSKAGASPVTVNVYRTIGTSPDVFYLAASSVAPTASPATNQPIVNDATVDTVSFVDELSDADIIGNPRLYTTGNVLEANAPPPMRGLVSWQNRLWGVDSENPRTLVYTPEILPGQPATFSDYLTLNIDPRIGAATALAVMDEKLVIAGADSFWFTSGAGPDSTGAGGAFQDPQLVPGDSIGCTNPRSLVLTEQGLAFQSAKGLWLLSRALGLTYAGAEVEELVEDASVTSARSMPSSTQTRFTLDSGRALYFDSFVGQWATRTNLDAVDGVVWNGAFTYLRPDGEARVETDAYADAGAPINIRLRTAPIRLTGLAGFQRARLLELVGTYESAHSIEISVMFDGNPAAVQTVTVTPTAPSTWGSSETWGSDSVWGGAFQPYIWRVFLNVQKCESLQVSVREIQPAASPGAGMSLSGLTLELGAKKGAWKAPASSTFGG